MWASTVNSTGLIPLLMLLLSFGTAANGLTTSLQSHAEHLKALELRIKALEDATDVNVGTLLWKITDFGAKLRAAAAAAAFSASGVASAVAPAEVLFSPLFLTGAPYGYKVQAYLYPNGIVPDVTTNANAGASASTSYMSLYINLLPSEWGSLLKWPCLGPIIVTIHDQGPDAAGETNDIVVSLQSFPWDGGFANPTTGFGGPEQNKYGVGWPQPVSYDILRAPGRNYLLNDTLALEIQYNPIRRTPVAICKETAFGGEFKTLYVGTRDDCVAMGPGYRDWASSINTHGACIIMCDILLAIGATQLQGPDYHHTQLSITCNIPQYTTVT